jgi:hypothetical protein
MDCLNEFHGDNFSAYQGDCVSVAAQLPDACIDFSVYSPPFGSLFVYSDSAVDMGNSSSDGEFAQHYSYLVREKFRITKPGRISAVHCSDLPLTKWKDGAVGIKDFSGDIIRIHQEAGWIFHSRRTIWKCPVVEMTRTKHVGLLYKQLRNDSAKSRGGMPDYLLTFTKPGENTSPITHTPDDFPVEQWQEWASPVWMSINQTKVLNVKTARTEKDEKHLCLARGSMVLTRDGYRPIEDIEVGDMVLTHKGRWRPVIAKACNGVKDVLRITAHGVPELVCTPDHPLWTRIGRTTHPRKIAMNTAPAWVQAQDTLASYVNLPLPPIEESSLSAEDWWIVGRWLGDGHMSVRNQPLITCAFDETEELLTAMGGRAGGVYATQTARQIYVKGRGGNGGSHNDPIHLMIKRCGKGAHGKRVPSEALALNPELAESLLSGYLSADGHKDRLGRWHATSVSRSLALGIALVAQRARGIVASVYRGRRSGIANIQGRTVKTRDEWKILISSKNDSAFIKTDGAWKKVRSNAAFGQSEVWDIQVADDESFVAEGCVVHNCPLQLDIIERALVLWSNPGDTVLSPFMGIGSEGFMTVRGGRRFVGIELKEAYFRQAVDNLKGASAQSDMFA